ncbi:MAG TPA: choice-of-anchor Q domain-containing protein, partial [Jatrophihabitans sp.]
MRLAPLAVLLCAAFLALAGPAAAQTFNVTTTDDDVGSCDPGDCSVREAFAAADASAEADTVNIPAGHYVLTQGQLEIDEINDTLTVNGAGARNTILDANGQSRVLFIDDGLVTMSRLTFTGGNSDQGAGIFENDEQLTLDHVAVVGNTAATPANDPSFGGQGGGIFANEPVTMTNSVVSGNIADGAGASFSGGQGGGIFANEPVDLTNVTIANNQAKAAPPGATFPHSQGGGIFVNEVSTLKNVTLAGNQASGDDAGAGLFVNDNLTIQNSLVAGNTTDGVQNNCINNEETITGDHNLEGGTDCGFTATGDIQNADPLLGALADNGGETDTEALLSGSPAIDHADGASCPATDQRDLPRPQFAGCDMGAFEVQPTAAAPPAPVATADT